jgi:hypothetical protein
MPGNLKRPQAESAIGTVNSDLSRTATQADPRFLQEPDGEENPAPESGLKVEGKGPDAKIVVKPQALSSTIPGYPRNKPIFVAPERKRT